MSNQVDGLLRQDSQCMDVGTIFREHYHNSHGIGHFPLSILSL